MTYFGILNKVTHVGLGEMSVKLLRETMYLLVPHNLPAETGTTLPSGLPNLAPYQLMSSHGITAENIMPLSCATWMEPPTFDDPMDGISKTEGDNFASMVPVSQ